MLVDLALFLVGQVDPTAAPIQGPPPDAWTGLLTGAGVTSPVAVVLGLWFKTQHDNAKEATAARKEADKERDDEIARLRAELSELKHRTTADLTVISALLKQATDQLGGRR